MPCPMGVNIPGTFSVWNNYGMYEDKKETAEDWNDFNEKSKPLNCVKCGKCEVLCPQNLKIRDNLATAQKELDAIAKGETV